MPADQCVDLTGFHRVEQCFEAGAVLAVERGDVVVVEAVNDLPVEAVSQCEAVVELAGDAEAFAGLISGDAGVDGAAGGGHATSMSP